MHQTTQEIKDGDCTYMYTNLYDEDVLTAAINLLDLPHVHLVIQS